MFPGNWNIGSSCEISLGYGFCVSRNMGLEKRWKGSIRKTALEEQHWKDSIGRTALEGQHWKDRIGNPPSEKEALGWEYQLGDTQGIALGFLCFAREPTLFPCMSRWL
jgi:hypothetical protein